MEKAETLKNTTKKAYIIDHKGNKWTGLSCEAKPFIQYTAKGYVFTHFCKDKDCSCKDN